MLWRTCVNYTHHLPTTRLAFFFACTSILDIPMSSDEETDGLNVTIEWYKRWVTVCSNPSKNGERMYSKKCSIKYYLLHKFIKQVNEICCCTTPGCKGALTPIYVRSVGLGGAVTISCTCNGCGNQGAIFETSSKYELGSATEISTAIQVAFIVAGFTHMMYYKVLKHFCAFQAISHVQFGVSPLCFWALQLFSLSLSHTHTHTHSLLTWWLYIASLCRLVKQWILPLRLTACSQIMVRVHTVSRVISSSTYTKRIATLYYVWVMYKYAHRYNYAVWSALTAVVYQLAFFVFP